MPATVVLGAQWGDEGKAKIADRLAEKADCVVRFNGGANAGNTTKIGERVFPMHLLPSGIFREGVMNLVGPGVALDPNVVLSELALAKEFGSFVQIDKSTPIVLPIHRLMDAAREKAAGALALGTTKRGIAPCYSDFWLRRGVTLEDLRSRIRIQDVFARADYWNELCASAARLGGEGIDFRDLGMVFDPLCLEDTMNWCVQMGEVLTSYAGDTRHCVHEMLAEDKEVLFQGAHGVLLDTYHGTRPFNTASICTAAGVSATFGVYHFRVIGVAKAYATRVGAGPFPTELQNEEGEEIRCRGHEYGTTTGRPRRCGWLDIPALAYACRMAGIQELAITKLDVLAQMDHVRLCTSYGNTPQYQTLTSTVLSAANPMYKDFLDFSSDITHARTFSELPPHLRSYLNHIQVGTGIPITFVGVGPEREQIVVK